MALAVFILWSVWAPRPERRLLPPRRFALVGLATSFATMFIGATGPLVAAFLPPERYGRLATVATHGACMTAQHLFKIVAFGLLGFSLASWLPLISLMLLSGFAGSWSGKQVLERLPEGLFRIGFRVILTALAFRPLVGALSGAE